MRGIMRSIKDFLQWPYKSIGAGSCRNVEDRDDEAEDRCYQGEEVTVEEKSDVPIDVPTSPSEKTCHERH